MHCFKYEWSLFFYFVKGKEFFAKRRKKADKWWLMKVKLVFGTHLKWNPKPNKSGFFGLGQVHVGFEKIWDFAHLTHFALYIFLNFWLVCVLNIDVMLILILFCEKVENFLPREGKKLTNGWLMKVKLVWESIPPYLQMNSLLSRIWLNSKCMKKKPWK